MNPHLTAVLRGALLLVRVGPGYSDLADLSWRWRQPGCEPGHGRRDRIVFPGVIVMGVIMQILRDWD